MSDFFTVKVPLGYEWFLEQQFLVEIGPFSGVFLPYDVCALLMLMACVHKYDSKASHVAAIGYAIIMLIGSQSAYLQLHEMIQKAIFAIIFMIPLIPGVPQFMRVKDKSKIGFLAFLTVQLIYSAKHITIIKGDWSNFITPWYSEASFLSIVLLVLLIKRDDNGVAIVDRNNNPRMGLFQALVSRFNRSSKKEKLTHAKRMDRST